MPFIGKDVPSRAAEFAHPDILLGLSVLAYRYNGLRTSDMKMVVKELKRNLLNEPGPFSERPTRMLFEEFKEKALQQWNLEQEQEQKQAAAKGEGTAAAAAGGKLSPPPELLPLELLQVDDPQQLRALVQLLSKVPEVVLFYLDSLVFPSVMKHRSTKLQASGVDLGSDMLFGTRLGFSGTPSDLLPRELKPCHYERGSEAKIVRILTSTKHVDSEFVPAGWSVDSLLREIAQPSSGKTYSALIDTGALITGYSNEQVARLLLDFGLDGMDACVFIDGDDRRMVVDRLDGPPVPLARSGIKLEKRFTFYDQVHTTGMDIKQALDAVAVVTLGKDMTLRDYSQVSWLARELGSVGLTIRGGRGSDDDGSPSARAECEEDWPSLDIAHLRLITYSYSSFVQGCWRMRGLGKGQRIHLMIVKEVAEIINKALSSGGGKEREAVKAGPRQPLVDAVAWLVTNSMRSEMMQYLQLQMQVISCLWRKEAFRELTRSKTPKQRNFRTESMLTTRFHAPLSEPGIVAALSDIPDMLKEDAKTADELTQELESTKMDTELLFLWYRTFLAKLPDPRLAQSLARMLPPPLLQQASEQGMKHPQLKYMLQMSFEPLYRAVPQFRQWAPRIQAAFDAADTAAKDLIDERKGGERKKKKKQKEKEEKAKAAKEKAEAEKKAAASGTDAGAEDDEDALLAAAIKLSLAIGDDDDGGEEEKKEEESAENNDKGEGENRPMLRGAAVAEEKEEEAKEDDSQDEEKVEEKEDAKDSPQARLTRCITLFREPLDLDVAKEVPRGFKPFIDVLEELVETLQETRIVAEASNDEDDRDATASTSSSSSPIVITKAILGEMRAHEAEIEALKAKNKAEGGGEEEEEQQEFNDREIVQEQEKEKDQEQKQEIFRVVRPVSGRDPNRDSSWLVRALLGGYGVGFAGVGGRRGKEGGT